MPMEEFDCGSSKRSTKSSEQANNPNLQLCGASKSSMQIDGSQWHREVEKEDYIPYPFLEALMELVKWVPCLITLDTAVLRPGPNFFDENGYNIHPLNMIGIVDSLEEEPLVSNMLVDEVLVEDVPIGKFSQDEGKSELTYESRDEDDWEVLEEELDKVRLLFKH